MTVLALFIIVHYLLLCKYYIVKKAAQQHNNTLSLKVTDFQDIVDIHCIISYLNARTLGDDSTILNTYTSKIVIQKLL